MIDVASGEERPCSAGGPWIRHHLGVVVLCGLVAAFSGLFPFSHAVASDVLHAGGSTLVFPAMRKWTAVYRGATGITVDYDSVGSGRGINGMLDREFDFGCTDAPLSDEELERVRASGEAVIHVPVAIGAVAPIYNLPVGGEALRFSGPVLADIFLGRITRWNDPALAALNPARELPDLPIGVVHRSDSSGTTYVWTDYLSKVSADWEERVGVGKTVSWPTGTSGRGNEGVAGQVKLWPGSIGYAQLTYGVKESLQHGSVENREGNFIDPQSPALAAAIDASLTMIPDDLRFSFTNPPGEDSYPIGSTTWAVLYVRPPRDQGKAIVDFLRWVIHDGQQVSAPLHFAPLPRALVARAEQQLARIQTSAK